MYEAFVLVCLLGQPTLDGSCEQLADTRGPYMTYDQCLARVYEIQRDFLEIPLVEDLFHVLCFSVLGVNLSQRYARASMSGLYKGKSL